jgi:hypothetical protein
MTDTKVGRRTATQKPTLQERQDRVTEIWDEIIRKDPAIPIREFLIKMAAETGESFYDIVQLYLEGQPTCKP